MAVSLRSRQRGRAAGRAARWSILALLPAAVLAATFAPEGSAPRTIRAASSAVDIVVLDASTGLAIPHFKWQVNLDNSHDNTTITEPIESYSPVVATGDETTATGVVLDDTAAPNRGYLVSVLANDGVGTQNEPDYKVGGAAFKMPSSSDVVVKLVPNPLPLATVRTRVFHDNLSVNNAEDLPVEEGLPAFNVIVFDRVGEVTTDWFGNPICTDYVDVAPADGIPDLDIDGSPTPIPGTGGTCLSDANGDVVIRNLGPNKYTLWAIPPDGTTWIQTSTIEGKHDFDVWLDEGNTGYAPDVAFSQNYAWFGFVRPCAFGDLADDCTSLTADTEGDGTITGRIRGNSGEVDLALGQPVPSPYLALNNLGGNDEQVWTGRGNPDGTFTIEDVPPGHYQLVIWDYPQDYIIQFLTVDTREATCTAPCTVDLGDVPVPYWFGQQRGSVYIDSNQNGVRDPGEPGLPGFDVDIRFKDGSIYAAGFADGQGDYAFNEIFPFTKFLISEVGYGRLKHTGAAAYATDALGNPLNYPWVNDCTDIDGNPVAPCTPGSPPRECTNAADWRSCERGPINQDAGLAGLLQAGIIQAGLSLYIDWGKATFTGDENGGIAGIVFNATTRNELNPALQANEDFEAGVAGATVNLYAPVLDIDGNPVYDPTTGEVMKDHIANTYATDSYYQGLPANCTPIGTIGRAPSQVQPYPQIWDQCLELIALQNQTKSGVFDGGYAFEEDCADAALPNPAGDDDSDGVPNRLDPDLLSGSCIPLAAGKWVIQTEPPVGFGPVKEEDINVFDGDQFFPQLPSVTCVGKLHTVDVVGDPIDANFDPSSPDTTQGVYNPNFLDTTSPASPLGGSPYEGARTPLCDQKLVTVQRGFNAAADFHLFTQVPYPGRLQGLLTDDLHSQLNPANAQYGDKIGIPRVPIGIRDFTGQLLQTVYTDDAGYFEALLPSTGSINCATPAGVCPNMYLVIGNDPGDPGAPNAGWNPNYGSIKLIYDVWPGLTTNADVAIFPITGFVANPNAEPGVSTICGMPATTPDVQHVSRPYGDATGDAFSIFGSGFGSIQNHGRVTLAGVELPVTSWSDTQIDVTLPAGSAEGPQQLLVSNDLGVTGLTGITFHALGAGYNPPQRHVGTGQPYATIQSAIDDAAAGDLILVHPGTYYETIVLGKNVKLQGYGVGTTNSPTSGIGSQVDSRFFGLGGMTAEQFNAKVAATPYDGPTTVPLGQAITVLAKDGDFGSAYTTQIDGFGIRGGQRTEGEGNFGAVQGGAVYAHAYARHLQVSNNLIQSNSGVAGGGIILGQPYTPNPTAGGALDAENDFVRLHHNRVLNNGGIISAGGIGIFNGAAGFQIDHNLICGNYSAEYGGGVSNFGMSSGVISDNEILYNNSFDEGAGVMVAGELNLPNVSPGTGDIDILRNRIQGNVTNDDGGGIRLLQSVGGQIRIHSNLIVNNLATDTGGGISLDDALHVEVLNNTVSRNISTATAVDADRTSCAPPLFGTCPHAAGLSSQPHSAALVAAAGLDCLVDRCFSDPVLFNNIFWHNEAFYLDGTQGLLGGGLPSAGYMDLELLGSAQSFEGTYNTCTSFGPHCLNDGTNATGDPLFVSEITSSFLALAFVGDPAFVTVLLQQGPADPQGNYHLTGGSPAIDAGTAVAGAFAAPGLDVDEQPRPLDGNQSGLPYEWDMGGDEVPESAEGLVAAATGGAVSTGAAPAADNPLATTVNVPPGAFNQDAVLAIVETSAGGAPSGFNLLGQQANITVSPGTVFLAPVVIDFRVHASLVPSNINDVQIFRNGTPVADCVGPLPDPCIVSRTLMLGGDLLISVSTTGFSNWAVGLSAGAPGDANCDAAISMTDALLIARYAVGLAASLPCPQNADVNGAVVVTSNDISMTDALLVARSVIGLATLP